jgi:hypothetical protein
MYDTPDRRGILGYLITFIVNRMYGRTLPEKCPRCGKDDWIPKRAI